MSIKNKFLSFVRGVGSVLDLSGQSTYKRYKDYPKIDPGSLEVDRKNLQKDREKAWKKWKKDHDF